MIYDKVPMRVGVIYASADMASGRSPRMTASAEPPPEGPATLSALEEVVGEVSAKFPRSIPAGTAATFAAAGYTMTRAKSEMFRMIAGGDLATASMQRELSRAGFEPTAGAGPAQVSGRANMINELRRAGVKPKGNA